MTDTKQGFKLCPFCGPDRAQLLAICTNTATPEVTWPECTWCGSGGIHFSAYDWNNRPIEEGLERQVAALEAQLAALRRDHDLVVCDYNRVVVDMDIAQIELGAMRDRVKSLMAELVAAEVPG